MNVSKKILQKLICFCLVMVIGIGLVSSTADAASKGFAFKYKKVSAYMNDKAASLIKKAGTPDKKTSVKSCAYKGMDRTYTYDDFVIKTYSKSTNGAEYISSIKLLTKKVETAEGITIGSTKNAMIKEYGKNAGEFGVYTYEKGKTKLVIELDDSDKVISIEYIAD